MVLVGVQARRNYVAERDGKGVGTKIVDENGQVVRMQGPWTVYVIGALPLNAISRAWGWANNLTLPVWFRPFGFKLYAYIFGCNLDEMKDPDLTHYKSLGEFFYRELKEGARKIDDSILVSPADGKVLHFGEIAGRRVEQVKGITYSLDALLGVTSAPEATESVVGKSEEESQHARIDDRQFASVNGIDYTLDELLGDEKSKSAMPDPDEVKKRKSKWTRFVKASYWKSWVKRAPSDPATATGVAPSAKPTDFDSAADADADDGDEGSADAATKKQPKQIDDAGMPEPDTPEVLGRYANVAYEMGVGALPPLLQPHSPGQKGLKEGNKLFFCVIYLAPGDYHRFHSPTNWVAERRRHFRGELTRCRRTWPTGCRTCLCSTSAWRCWVAGATASSAWSPWARPTWVRSASTLTRRCAPMCACSATWRARTPRRRTRARASCLVANRWARVMRWAASCSDRPSCSSSRRRATSASTSSRTRRSRSVSASAISTAKPRRGGPRQEKRQTGLNNEGRRKHTAIPCARAVVQHARRAQHVITHTGYGQRRRIAVNLKSYTVWNTVRG